MNYQETLAFMFSQLPMYQRLGQTAFKKDLTNISLLCEALGNPQNKFKSVHIGGTNGKGSSSHLLSAILQSAGYKTGLYTSPHLKNYTERIKINGNEVSKDFVVAFIAQNKIHIEKIKPSFFELTVAMAFDFFAKQKVDVAIIEVGLGGRLDSTNIISPQVSLITNISLDHQQMLGDTIEEIAFEKAGIIKENTPIVISEKQEKTTALFFKTSQEKKTQIHFASDNFEIKTKGEEHYAIFHNEKPYLTGISLALRGEHQQKNLLGVLQVVEIVKSQGFTISNLNLKKGIQEVLELTRFQGRWQVISQSPLTICDIGHNEDAIQIIIKQLAKINYQKLHFVIGTVNDKDVDKMLNQLPKDATYYFCQAQIPRALAVDELQQKAEQHQLKGKIIPDVKTAILTAQNEAQEGDLVFVGGSAFVVAEAI
jgi:dihydrofolate synthase/folylpolyglutamate synthase